MKKGIYAILAALAVFALVMTGCDTGGGDDPKPDTNTYWTVTFDANNGSTNTTVKVKSGEKVTAPTAPTKAGSSDSQAFDFDAWYTSNTTFDATTKFIFNTAILEDITLYANWIEYDPSVTVNVQFDLNGGTNGTAPTQLSTNPGRRITLPDVPTGVAKAGYLPDGWSDAATGGTAYAAGASFTIPPTATATNPVIIYVKWAVAYTVAFDVTGATGTAPENLKPAKAGATVTLPGIGSVTKTDNTFNGWAATTSGTYKKSYVIDAKDAAAVSGVQTITLTATWVPEIVEEIVVGKAWNPVYKFTLPASGKWSNYTGAFTVEYKLDTDTLKNSAPRAVRVMGQFLQVEVENPKLGTSVVSDPQVAGIAAAQKIAIVGDWPGGTSNDWIYSQIGSSWTGGQIPETLANFLDAGVDIKADTWFRVNYPANTVVGAGPNGTWNGTGVRAPDNDDEGPFYFAFGLPGENANTFQIKNVKLVGKEGTADVVAVPLYYIDIDGTDVYRAFNGQLSDADGTKRVKYTLSSGTVDKVNISATTITANQITLTFDANFTDSTASDGTTKVFNKGSVVRWTDFASLLRPGYRFVDWFTEAAKTNVVPRTFIKVLTENVTYYADWLRLPDAKEDLVLDVSTYKFSIFGGLGALNSNAGPGPFEYRNSYSYAACVWFGLPTEAGTANYDQIIVTYTVVRKSNEDPVLPAKLAFSKNRGEDKWSGGTEVYESIDTTVAGNKTWTASVAECYPDGVILKHNKGVGESCDFDLTIVGIKLTAPSAGP